MVEKTGRRVVDGRRRDLFRLVSEARRISLAYLFDPFLAVQTSTLRTLPHQIDAVYNKMLPRQPLRFLLADDPGAGKTIMGGLFCKELMIRGDVERCLIIAPGSLVEQWQDELWQNMPRLFEDFVTVALREALVPAYGGRVDDQDQNHFDEAGQVRLRPDIVWKIRGSAVAVIDAKYKAEKPAGYPNADLYQLLAHCTVLGLRSGHLVYAQGNEKPVRHVVRRSGIEIFSHAVDLDQDPDVLISHMRDLAQTIASTRLTALVSPTVFEGV